MSKPLNLVHVQQNGAVIQFYNKADGRCIAMIELSTRATYTEITTYIFSVAEAVEQFIEELIDCSVAVNAAHRALMVVTIVNVTSVHKTVHMVKGGRIMARVAPSVKNRYLDCSNRVVSFYDMTLFFCQNKFFE